MNIKVIIVSLAMAAFFAAPIDASASVLWDNGPAIGDSGHCNSSAPTCGDTNGWTIYDDFQLTAGSTIRGLTYNSDFNFNGSPASYDSTIYSIWSSNPSTSYAAGPVYSGTVTGIETPDAVGTTLITITGLNIPLKAGTYWLGLSNNVNDGSITTYDASTSFSGDAIQSDNSGSFFSPGQLEEAFTIEGVAGGVPEPATWTLMLTGVGGIGAAMRSRRKRPIFAV
jgi:hypothetical protein